MRIYGGTIEDSIRSYLPPEQNATPISGELLATTFSQQVCTGLEREGTRARVLWESLNHIVGMVGCV